MMGLDLVARMKSTDEFIEAATDADLSALSPNGTSLLMAAVGNTHLDSRYATARWLLERGSALGPADSEGYTEMHVLFGQVEHDIASDADIARRLLEIGADINAVSPRGGLVLCEVLRMKYDDADLEPIYDLWFDQPVVLDFESPSARGSTPLSIARARPYRAGILDRMQRYISERA